MKSHLLKLNSKPLSWSAISSWTYNQESWAKKYLEGIYETSKEMDYGKVIDLKIQEDPTFLPKLPRYEKMQYKMLVRMGGIDLIGLPDGVDLTTTQKKLSDYKTGKNKWDQKRAQETGQLLFYLLLLYITHKIKPEEFDCYIHWLPTRETGDFKIEMIKEDDIHTFKVKHTMQDILNFALFI
jgi:hypothetical protein